MRELLSDLITQAAIDDPSVIVLSGDHGYALFDQIRQKRPGQFINVGVSEQAMIGYAAGLCRTGFKPIVYGLAAFVPVRVLEQIKLDICFSRLPVILLGDGAGVVYSTLGASHHCAEDLSCLRPLPDIQVFSPCDNMELSAVFSQARAYGGPSYLRIGKSDRPDVSHGKLIGTEPHFVVQGDGKTCLIATGSMVSIASECAKRTGISAISVPRIKPFDARICDMTGAFKKVIVIEEHSRYGGLATSLAESYCENLASHPKLEIIALEGKFAHRCGSWQYALSEHRMSDPQIEARIREML